MLGPGSVFAGYRLERILGSGGMGTVYLARDPDLPRWDALKVLSSQLSRDADFRARFVREADVAAGLNHPNIVSIYDRGDSDGQLWIAMQFVDGTDAEKALSAGTMTPRRAVHVIGEVARALDYAHHRNVVHRDVKPANFLIANDGGDTERVLLADFGIARALDEGSSITGAGSLLATVTYAAPESLSGGSAGAPADIYALGCSLFRLLTGRVPFDPRGGTAAVMLAHLNQPPPRVTAVRPGLPPALDAVIAKAMAKDPAQRYRSARELAAAAAAAFDHSAPMPAATPSGWQATPTAGWPVAPSGGPQPPPYTPPGLMMAPPATPKPKSGRGRLIGVLAGVAVLVAGTVGAVVVFGGDDEAEAGGGGTTSLPSSSESVQAAKPLSIHELRDLLLPLGDVQELAGGRELVEKAMVPAPVPNSKALQDKECVGAWAPGDETTYTGSGYSGAQFQYSYYADDTAKTPNVVQGVVNFLTVGTAKAFFDQQVTAWKACSDRRVTLKFTESTRYQRIGTPEVTSDGILTVLTHSDDNSRALCSHSLARRGNVIIEADICGDAASGAPSRTLVSRIAEGLPG
ncbi:hypothetical protein BST26_08240 [Mycolicibacterium insubricum]|uniref:non-specific serine/threonine protein kinase n=1 Tax=Mycolicibacterium insubricum TaxID=444597 RepID=A0A1X0DH71_9MYCO|nr:serine/threonine-protein kinase PknH/PknJ [Mycolicibacterium insubricum]ORA71509.1 hypothetical protein BST26_08240 [Mycolicibacterium insubricum]